mgnify:FL=1
MQLWVLNRTIQIFFGSAELNKIPTLVVAFRRKALGRVMRAPNLRGDVLWIVALVQNSFPMIAYSVLNVVRDRKCHVLAVLPTRVQLA